MCYAVENGQVGENVENLPLVKRSWLGQSTRNMVLRGMMVQESEADPISGYVPCQMGLSVGYNHSQ